jgi:hypothetical protein
MAARRTLATLMIALSIFVMLTLVLAVTTYIYVQQTVDLANTNTQLQRDLEAGNRALAAERAEKDRLRDIIGTTKETADTIEAEYNDLLQTRFAGFQTEPKSFRNLVDWLGQGLQDKEQRVVEFDAKSQADASKAERDTKEAMAAQEVAETAAKDAAANLQKAQESFEKTLAANVERMNEMLAAQKDANAKAERLEAITTELEKLGPVLSTDLRRRFSAPPPDGQPVPWPERVRLVYRELTQRRKDVTQLNETLARLGAADPELQTLVLDAQSYDDRIDGFDGRIATVNSVDKTVTISCASTGGMRPGLVLQVYGPDDPRPEFGSRKGSVQVIAIESGTRARGRITSDTVTDPILSGDGVATTLWSPGQPLEVAIVGYVSFAGDGDAGPALLRSLIERAGGTVVDTVTAQTSLVVDGGPPSASMLDRGPPGAWKPTDDARRKRVLEQTREFNVRVVGIDALLEVLGLDRSALASATVATPEAAPARPRDAAVAY